MSDGAKAIFLSYAREDTDAARRIADALRAFGLEVWFDQNELRGGDAWDAKIRHQIRQCGLFVPVISGHSQARHEGYFRREWRLAVDRTHDMAAGVAFIVPAVVDDTPEAEALVPEEFLRYQWTRLPHGVPTPEFVAQVKRLLESPRGPTAQKPEARDQRPEGKGEESEAGASRGRSGRPGWVWGVLIVVVAGAAIGVLATRRPATTPAPSLTPSHPAAPDAKSIAVLPFVNMSADKGNAYFCDGVQEDILTDLANIRDLRVISRTSVEQYRDTTKSIRQIAQELAVKWILEGSVQREGNKVRVTGQLINAATDEHVWAKAYDRDITDIFAIQSEIAQAIAGALQAAISPAEQVLLNRRRTTNPAAYDLLLQARDLPSREGNTYAARARQIALLQNAVKLDPDFPDAWAELADMYAFGYFNNDEGMDALLTRAKAAMDRAVQLAPEAPEVISSLGTYYYYGYRDYTRAAEQYGRLAQLQPNDPTVFNSLGLILRRQGQWAESLADTRRAVELDPANIQYLRNLLSTLQAGRRWDEAVATQQRIVALLPDKIAERYVLAALAFQATGSTRAGRDFFAGLSPEQRESPRGISLRESWAAETGDFAEAVRLDRRQPYFDEDGTPHWQQALGAAICYLALGDRAGATGRLGDFPAELHTRLQREPKNALYWGILGGMEAVLGHRDEARRCADRCVELLPVSRDALDGVTLAFLRAYVYDLTGDRDTALAEYARLLREPCTAFGNVHDLQAGYSTLHGDPRFQALLRDPTNNAALF